MSCIIIKAKVKDYARIDNKPLNVTADFADALSEKAVQLIQDACKRAKANGRNTIMPKDL